MKMSMTYGEHVHGTDSEKGVPIQRRLEGSAGVGLFPQRVEQADEIDRRHVVGHLSVCRFVVE